MKKSVQKVGMEQLRSCHGQGTSAEALQDSQILLMFVKQIFEDFENLENKKESNLNKTCCCRPAVNSYNESGQIYLYNSIARA